MGTLGKYLLDARELKGIDIRDAAQQTRISVQFLIALETEHFEKLPGEVFVRGFLKSYAKFLRLDETEVMRKYEETRNPPVVAPAVPVTATELTPVEAELPAEPVQKPDKLPIGPFIWGFCIVAAVAIFLFVALPAHRQKMEQNATQLYAPGSSPVVSSPVGTPVSEKLYLEVVALENTWILVRTDASPQKKAVLNKGESLIWSAEDRFVLSFGNAQAVKLMLNGQDLIVDEPKNTVVRDLVVTAKGIVTRKTQAEVAAVSRVKRKKIEVARQPVQPAQQEKPLQPQQETPRQQTQVKQQPLAPIITEQAPEPQPKPQPQTQAEPAVQPSPAPESAPAQ